MATRNVQNEKLSIDVLLNDSDFIQWLNWITKDIWKVWDKVKNIWWDVSWFWKWFWNNVISWIWKIWATVWWLAVVSTTVKTLITNYDELQKQAKKTWLQLWYNDEQIKNLTNSVEESYKKFEWWATYNELFESYSLISRNFEKLNKEQQTNLSEYIVSFSKINNTAIEDTVSALKGWMTWFNTWYEETLNNITNVIEKSWKWANEVLAVYKDFPSVIGTIWKDISLEKFSKVMYEAGKNWISDLTQLADMFKEIEITINEQSVTDSLTILWKEALGIREDLNNWLIDTVDYVSKIKQIQLTKDIKTQNITKSALFTSKWEDVWVDNLNFLNNISFNIENVSWKAKGLNDGLKETVPLIDKLTASLKWFWNELSTNIVWVWNENFDKEIFDKWLWNKEIQNNIIETLTSGTAIIFNALTNWDEWMKALWQVYLDWFDELTFQIYEKFKKDVWPNTWYDFIQSRKELEWMSASDIWKSETTALTKNNQNKWVTNIIVNTWAVLWTEEGITKAVNKANATIWTQLYPNYFK